MVEVENEFLRRTGLEATHAYVDFGLEQVAAVNEAVVKWLAAQSFAEQAPSPVFVSMKVSGSSMGRTYDHRDQPDSVEWTLHFEEQPKSRKKRVLLGRSDALLHSEITGGRLPNVTEHNSGPDIGLSTNNYISFAVRNGERGWVQEGTFPIGTRGVHKPAQRIPTIGIDEPELLYGQFIDIRRNAKAGFRAAREWAKFRTMFLACSDFVGEQMAREFEASDQDWDANQRIRDQGANVYRLLLELFPDSRIRDGPAALRPYYEPGFLEGVIALELERGHTGNFSRRPDGHIYQLRGSPIEIQYGGKPGTYDARMRVLVSTHGGELGDAEPARRAVEAQLGKYFDVTAKTASQLLFTFNVPDAHRVVDQIRGGATDTPLHVEARAVVEVMGELYEKARIWTEHTAPALRTAYEAGVEGSMERHFAQVARFTAGQPNLHKHSSEK